MATTKAKTTAKPKKTTSTTARKSTKATTSRAVAAKTEKVDKPIFSNSKKGNPVKEFFARKYDANENILTIFRSPRIIGALLGEIIGTMILSVVLLTMGVYQPLYIMFGVIAITVAVYSLSGAHINPLVTMGHIATRRVSPIRGTLYIIAQVLGAWLGLLIAGAFAGAVPEMAAALPKMSVVEDEMFWVITMLEFFGATVIGFFFARALAYKRSVFTFAAVVGGGVSLAFLLAVVISSSFLGAQDNFILNPAVAIMYQVLPTEGATFGDLFGNIALALTTYVIFPLLGGVVGFYVSDLASKFSGEKLE